MFDCPIHGLEDVIFCFRAFDEANLNLWKKFEFNEIEIPEEEKRNLMDNLKNRQEAFGD